VDTSPAEEASAPSWRKPKRHCFVRRSTWTSGGWIAAARPIANDAIKKALGF